MRIHLPNSARLQNLAGFFRQFDPGNPGILEFSMHDRWVAVHPVALAFAACVADRVTSTGGAHVGDVQPIGSLPYLIRMGLFNHIHLDYGKGIAAHEEAGRFIPISQIRESGELSEFIINMIPLLHASPAQVEPIRYVISELVRNVLEHSASESGAFLCAQYYRSSGTLSIGVADAGVGIRTTMSRFHNVPTDWDALLLAMRPGISGTTSRIGGTDYNAGAGLFFTKSIACASRNYFAIYSGSEMFKLRLTPAKSPITLHADPNKDRHTRETELPPWNGTVVGLDIALDKQQPFSQLMELVRKAYGLDVKGQKKAKYKKPRFA